MKTQELKERAHKAFSEADTDPGLSAAWWAERLHVTGRTICRWRKGSCKPNPLQARRILRICQLLDEGSADLRATVCDRSCLIERRRRGGKFVAPFEVHSHHMFRSVDPGQRAYTYWPTYQHAAHFFNQRNMARYPSSRIRLKVGRPEVLQCSRCGVEGSLVIWCEELKGVGGVIVSTYPLCLFCRGTRGLVYRFSREHYQGLDVHDG